MTKRLLHLTDFHLFADPDERLKGVPTRETLDLVIEHIRATQATFDQVVITGDHTHDELQETYEYLRTVLTDWLPILNTVPGNHDDRELIRRVFEDCVPDSGPLTFATDLGAWRLFGLDSHVPGEVSGHLPTAQLDWLRDQAAAFDGPVGVFFHHPPVPVGSVWMDRVSLENAAEFRASVADLENLKFVCCGHVHCPFSLEMDGVSVFTTPSTGVQFDPNSEEALVAVRPPGYRVFEFNGDAFETSVIELPEIPFLPTLD